uniref:Inosine/uridine-preferring nucleoside hydrolase domain-containing protein n=1 Tax=Fagus sylvatica TaxID=28930 RepID=A0A2N9HHN7_FAGSY
MTSPRPRKRAVTINANSWVDAGHAVNQIYDILHMMDRDDVAVGVGGDGGILEDGTILPNVGGYLPIIDQGYTTVGYCRYRQTIPNGQGGRLDVDANYGIRKAFLPQCGEPPGNLFTAYSSNPYAEANIFGDPFAAYQVFHSGIPITLVPLDATDTIPLNENFYNTFEQSQNTYEAQYSFQSLKIARETWFRDIFFTSYFMWDSFAAGVAISIMRNSNNQNGKNEFAEMEYMNITVVTSNKPYGVYDGSNPVFDGLDTPKFNLTKGGVHSGHVQTGLQDPFCIVKNGKGKCQDGYTAEVAGPEAVRVLVATKAKPNRNKESPLNREYYRSFLDALNHPQHTGRFNFTTQFPYYKEVLFRPDFGSNKLGKPLVFDMDMSAGDFLALFYLLKVPVEVINLKAIIVSPTGWANAATIDILYDLLHMMGRDDIPVGLGDVFAMHQSDPNNSAVGDCKYAKAIPYGSGGLIDSDTLYGLARDFPRSPRRYTQDNSTKDGAPQLKQPLALEVWKSIVETLDPGSKVTILTNGPLTNLAKIILSEKNATSLIKDVYIVGGHISHGHWDKGNVFTVPSNEYAEFNMFLDPLAAKTVFDSNLNITLIPLGIQRRDIFSQEILGAVALTGDLKPTVKVKPVKVIAEGVESTDGQTLIDEKYGKLVKILENVNYTTYYDLFANRLNDVKQSAVLGSFDEQISQWSRLPK